MLALSFLFIPFLLTPFVILVYVINNYMLSSVGDLSYFNLLVFNALILIFPLSIWFTCLALENKLISGYKVKRIHLTFSPLILCFILSFILLDSNFLSFLTNLFISAKVTTSFALVQLLTTYFIKLFKAISTVLVIFYFLQFLFEFVLVLGVKNKILTYKDFKVLFFVFITSILADFLASIFIIKL